MRAVIAIVVLALMGCATDEKKKKKEPEDVITPTDAADFTDNAQDGFKTKRQSSPSGEDFSLDGSGRYETWDAATPDEDLAATTDEDAPEEDDTVHEPVTANPLTDMVTIKTKQAPETSEIPSSDVQVYYVKKKQARVHREPSKKSSTSRTLDQGETVVVTVEGEWGRLHEGEWVQMKDLSQEPVGRTQTGRRWDK